MNEHDDRTGGAGPDTEAGRQAQKLADDARQAGQQALDTVTGKAASVAHDAKGSAADEVHNLSDALRAAAEKSRDGSPQERTFGQVADALADFSDTIRDKDLGQITGDVNDFARRNPMAFLGGAALVGFAAVRFAKATQQAPQDGRGSIGHAGGPGPMTGRQPHMATDSVGTAPIGDAPTQAARPEPQVGTSDEIPAPHTIPGGTR